MAGLAAPSQSILPDLVPDANAVDDEDDLEDDDDDDDDEQPPMRKGVSRLGISKKAWTPAEDEILTAVVEKQGPSRWSTIAHHLPGRNNPRSPSQKRGAHSPEVPVHNNPP